jgi:hypothetical protein
VNSSNNAKNNRTTKAIKVNKVIREIITGVRKA